MITILLINLALSIAINLIGFSVAFYLKTDKLTDFSYALSFVVLSAISLILSGKFNLPNFILLSLVALWALRLGSYLVIRIRRWGRDKRFDEIRSNFFKFLGFWIFQAITVWFVLISSILFFYENQSDSLEIANYAGALIFLIGLAIEAFADLQLYNFTGDKKNKGEFIKTGLWSRTRHPNYLGEITVWLGAWVYSFSALALTQQIIGFISPLFIYVMIRFISGVPKLEKNAEKKWGRRKDFEEYKRQSGLILPRI